MKWLTWLFDGLGRLAGPPDYDDGEDDWDDIVTSDGDWAKGDRDEHV